MLENSEPQSTLQDDVAVGFIDSSEPYGLQSNLNDSLPPPSLFEMELHAWNTELLTDIVLTSPGEFILPRECPTPPTNPAPYINVNSVDELLNPNETHTITWSDNIDGNVTIELVNARDNSLVKTLAARASSAYPLEWDIAQTFDRNLDYKIAIRTTDNNDAIGYSNVFSISPSTLSQGRGRHQGTVMTGVGGPTGCETNNRDYIDTDQYALNLDTRTEISISLQDVLVQKNRNLWYSPGLPFGVSEETPLRYSILNSTGEEVWNAFLGASDTVNTILGAGEYTLQVALFDEYEAPPWDGSYFCTQADTGRTFSASFEFDVALTSLDDSASPYINVNSVDEFLNPNEAHTITWSDNIDDNVTIELVNARDNSLVETLAAWGSSAYPFEWNIAQTFDQNIDYKIAIRSTNNNSIIGYSNAFSIIPSTLSQGVVQHEGTVMTGIGGMDGCAANERSYIDTDQYALNLDTQTEVSISLQDVLVQRTQSWYSWDLPSDVSKETPLRYSILNSTGEEVWNAFLGASDTVNTILGAGEYTLQVALFDEYERPATGRDEICTLAITYRAFSASFDFDVALAPAYTTQRNVNGNNGVDQEEFNGGHEADIIDFREVDEHEIWVSLGKPDGIFERPLSALDYFNQDDSLFDFHEQPLVVSNIVGSNSLLPYEPNIESVLNEVFDNPENTKGEDFLDKEDLLDQTVEQIWVELVEEVLSI